MSVIRDIIHNNLSLISARDTLYVVWVIFAIENGLDYLHYMWHSLCGKRDEYFYQRNYKMLELNSTRSIAWKDSLKPLHFLSYNWIGRIEIKRKYEIYIYIYNYKLKMKIEDNFLSKIIHLIKRWTYFPAPLSSLLTAVI